MLNTSFWKLFGLSQALVARIECALSTDCSERLGHSVLSAQLKLLHSVHSAAQCPEIPVHSVLSAFENCLFQCRSDAECSKALCVVWDDIEAAVVRKTNKGQRMRSEV